MTRVVANHPCLQGDGILNRCQGRKRTVAILFNLYSRLGILLFRNTFNVEFLLKKSHEVRIKYEGNILFLPIGILPVPSVDISVPGQTGKRACGGEKETAGFEVLGFLAQLIDPQRGLLRVDM